MRQCEIDSARRLYERERLLGMTENEAALDVAVDRLGLVLGGVEPDPVLADVLAMARPGAELELASMCGVLGGEDVDRLPAWLRE